MEKDNFFQLGFDKKQHLVSYKYYKQLPQSTEPCKGLLRDPEKDPAFIVLQ